MKTQLTPAGIEPATFRFVVQHLNHCATAVPPLTHNLSNIEAEEIMKYENLALQIKNIRKLDIVSVYTLVTSVGEVVTENFLKYLGNM